MRWLLFIFAGCGFHGPATAVPTGDAAPVGDPDAPIVMPDASTTDIDAGLVIDAALPIPDAPVNVAAPFALTGARWLLPCTAGTDHTPNATACHCALFSQQITVGGTAGAKWHVTARVRGVMEKIGYTGGTAGAGGWYAGGAPVNGADNVYQLTVDAPAPTQHYYINTGTNNGNHSYAFDFMTTFDIAAGANVTFAANGQDGIQWMGVDQNAAAISVAAVVDPGQPYDGQWARLDVITATPF